jgi:FG-GAP-like repeat
LKKKSTSQSAFFNLRVLIASLFCLAGIFTVLLAAGIYSGSAEAQPAIQAQLQPGAPTVARMIGPVSQNQDLRSLPYIAPAPEIEEKRLTRYPRSETGPPPASETSDFAQFQSLIKELLRPAPTMPGPLLTFDGMNSAQSACSCLPPDSDGDVGPNHYVNVVNTAIKVFDKSGNPLNGANGTTFNSFFAPLGNSTPCGAGQNKGDPFVFYDHLANRWVVSDFAFPVFPGNSFYECIGVSKTGDPVSGGWWLYALQVDPANANRLGDYPKMAMWNSGGNPPQNAYFLTMNEFTASGPSDFKGVRVYALDRASMIAGTGAGGPPNAIGFTIDAATLGDAYSLVPASFRTGSAPPAGTDEFLLAIDSPLNGGQPLTKVKGWLFHVDFGTPANSTLGVGANHAPNAQITVTAFVDAFTNTTTNLVPQQGTQERLDTLGDKIMTPVVYQNRNGTESLWASHTVCTDANCTGPTGVRWYQFDVTGGTFPAIPVQQQTWTNGGDGLWRWMSSIAVDQNGNTAIGYSASSTTQFPSIRYAGRLASDPLGNLAQGEAIMTNGGGAQTDSSGRWGDYSMLTIDPSDGMTFWHANEYFVTTSPGSWSTRIGKFKAGAAPCGSPNRDFNGDCKADILWQNSSTGQRVIWIMNGTTFESYVSLGTVGTSWSIAGGSGDFNGDGKAEILWQNSSTGQRVIWIMNGTTFQSYVSLGFVGTSWSIAGSGDFNGDGKADILWQNSSTGQRVIWLMNGTTFQSYVSLGTVGTSWSIAGSGDFNGDGKADILWQNSFTGQRVIWLMNGTTFQSYVSLGTVPTSWSIRNY